MLFNFEPMPRAHGAAALGHPAGARVRGPAGAAGEDGVPAARVGDRLPRPQRRQGQPPGEEEVQCCELGDCHRK